MAAGKNEQPDTPPPRQTAKVFVSYCREDVDWLKEFRRYAAPLEQDGRITFWDDQDIFVGMNWKDEIRASLASARIGVLLVTQNFLTTRFITEQEMPTLMAGTRIFWIPISASTFEYARFADCQAAHDPRQPLDTLKKPKWNIVWVAIVKKLEEAIDRLDEEPRMGTSRRLGEEATVVTSPPPPRVFPKPEDGPLPLDSRYYIERDVDQKILEYLNEPGETVTVKGHRQAGKSSLLVRLHAWAKANGRASCIVNFQGLDGATLTDPKKH
jgi:AAA domain-containing protein/TIR domain-containing protein